MPRDRYIAPADGNAAEERPCPKTALDLGPSHTSSDCHEVVARLRAQAECLEEILADLREEIDRIESEEIIDRTRERLYESES